MTELYDAVGLNQVEDLVKILSLQLKRMLEADANVLIFLADWHAWVNDKFGGNMEDIQKTAVYMEETFVPSSIIRRRRGAWSTSVLLGKPTHGFWGLLGKFSDALRSNAR